MTHWYWGDHVNGWTMYGVWVYSTWFIGYAKVSEGKREEQQ